MEKKLSPPEKERFVVFEQGDKGTSKGIRLWRTYGKFFLWEGSAEKLLSKESVSSGKALDLANVNTALIFQIRGNFLRLPLQGLI